MFEEDFDRDRLQSISFITIFIWKPHDLQQEQQIMIYMYFNHFISTQ